MYYALKMLDKFHIIKNHKVMHVHRERDILTDCKHPNIISLIGTFQDDANLYFIMEHGDHGDLNRMLRKLSMHASTCLCHSEQLPYDLAVFYCAEIVSALGYLHKKKIIHRDLKPENILINKHWHLKLVIVDI